MSQERNIAILSLGHEGSSIPLAKALSNKKCRVDYYLIGKNGVIKNVEGVDNALVHVRNLVGNIPEDCFSSLSKYLSGSRVCLKYLNTLSECKSLPIIRTLMPPVRRYIIRIICTFVNKNVYDTIILVGRYIETDDIVEYCKNLKSRNKIVLLHEVCNHKNPSFDKPSYLLDFLFQSNIQINVFSKNSYSDLIKYKAVNKERVSVIPFGVFETFSYLKEQDIPNLPSDYILFYGMISPYKGLKVLVDAINCSSFLKKKNTVIAGSGFDESMISVKGQDRFFVLNKYLSNNEIVTLIKNARVVVCPYLSMSQSGIVQTTFAFGVPIIASDLPGFREVIKNGVNGMLFPVGAIEELAHLLERVYMDQVFYDNIKKGAKSFVSCFPSYDWSVIADKYINLL